jgi:uncharacterized protein with FMN-binding domain
MSATGRNNKRLPGKLLLTTALVAISAGFAWWQKNPGAPHQTAAPAPAAVEIAAPSDPGSGVGGYVFHEGPAAFAITMPAGSHVEDGEYVSQEWESGYGTIKIKVRIRNGAFTGLDYLLVPDERERSRELSHMSKPLLIHEMIHEQKAKVDVITTATYTSWAFQDALTDVVLQATRPRLSARQINDAYNDSHNLMPFYAGNQ